MHTKRSRTANLIDWRGDLFFCVSIMKRRDAYRLGNTDHRLYGTGDRLVFRDVADIHDAEEHEEGNPAPHEQGGDAQTAEDDIDDPLHETEVRLHERVHVCRCLLLRVDDIDMLMTGLVRVVVALPLAHVQFHRFLSHAPVFPRRFVQLINKFPCIN